MHVKYATTIFSAIFLLLQVSTPMVDAIPREYFTDNNGFGNTNSVSKRRAETEPNSPQNNVIDQGFELYNTCVKDTTAHSSGGDVEVCFAYAFDESFVNTLAKAAEFDDATTTGQFEGLVKDMIANTKVCIVQNSPEDVGNNCLTTFREVLVDVSNTKE